MTVYLFVTNSFRLKRGHRSVPFFCCGVHVSQAVRKVAVGNQNSILIFEGVVITSRTPVTIDTMYSGASELPIKSAGSVSIALFLKKRVIWKSPIVSGSSRLSNGPIASNFQLDGNRTQCNPKEHYSNQLSYRENSGRIRTFDPCSSLTRVILSSMYKCIPSYTAAIYRIASARLNSSKSSVFAPTVHILSAKRQYFAERVVNSSTFTLTEPRCQNFFLPAAGRVSFFDKAKVLWKCAVFLRT